MRILSERQDALATLEESVSKSGACCLQKLLAKLLASVCRSGASPLYIIDLTKLICFYRHAQVLGKGAFGVVYAAQDKSSGTIYACKSIAKAKLVTEV